MPDVVSLSGQTHVLTLLDGVFPSRKLFVLTCNDKYRIDAEAAFNRCAEQHDRSDRESAEERL